MTMRTLLGAALMMAVRVNGRCCYWPETPDRCNECTSFAKEGEYCFGGEEQCVAGCGGVWCEEDPSLPAAAATSRAACVDDERFFKNGDESKRCAWVAQQPEQRCLTSGDVDGVKTFGYEACHATCGTCRSFCDMDDQADYSKDWRLAGEDNEDKGCAWVGEATTVRCRRVGRDGTFAFEACRFQCGTCEPPPPQGCDDDDLENWHMANQPSKGCDWVRDARRVRCSKNGADGRAAYEACPRACKVCSDYFDATCDEDSREWHKNNDPDKGCDWVALLPERRCGAKGDAPVRSPYDARNYAWQFCPRTCRTCVSQGTSSPVETYGELRVRQVASAQDPKLQVHSTKTGAPVQLKGLSMFWGNVGWGAEKYWNVEVVRYFAEKWHVSLIRCAVGVEDAGGYLSHPDQNWQQLENVVEACIEVGVYVIIDWHSHHAEDSLPQAQQFFRQVAARWGRFPNVIFEIYNEPIWTEWPVIKKYHEAVLPVIREVSENLALLGTRKWSQEVAEAAEDPVLDFDNVAYVVHFYAAQPEHGAVLRDKVQAALDDGVAIFASEWASVEANGDGASDPEATRTWLTLLAANAISHAMWSIHDKNEGASILEPGTPASTTDWDDDATFKGTGDLARSIFDGSFQLDAVDSLERS